jgi:peptide/nickel transport system permease protein
MRKRRQTTGPWARFRKNPGAIAGLALVVALAAMALLSPVLASDRPILLRDARGWHAPALSAYPIFGPLFRYPEAAAGPVWRLDAPIPFSPYGVDLSSTLEAPGRRHWLGTDDLGRDLASRMVHAAPASLAIGLTASAMALLLGCLIGGAAGYGGRIWDVALSRLIEIVLCFPTIFLVLALVALFPPSIGAIIAAIALTSWPNEARYARAEVLRIKGLDYARAARAAGAGPWRILFRHLLPNALSPVLVSATFGVASAILYEAALSFLGVGIQPPKPSWGGILALAESSMSVAWWLIVFPGLAIFLTVTAYNLVGEGLQDAANPRAGASF